MTHSRNPEGEPTPSNPEHEPDTSVQRFFNDLSRPETAAQVTTDRVDRLRSQMRAELEAVGIDFSTLETEEMKKALRERQFQRLTQGKGVAIAAALDHQTGNIDPATCFRTLLFRQWAQENSQDLPALESGSEYSRRRGLEQVLAQTIAFAAGAITPQDYLQDLKWRIGASLERPIKDKTEKESDEMKKDELRSQLKAIRQAYGIPGPKDDNRKEYTGYSRVKPEAIPGFWGVLKEMASADITILESSWNNLSSEDKLLLLGNDGKEKE